MRQLIAFALLFVCVPTGPGSAHAKMCFSGSPAPKCKSFFITEVGVGHKIGEVSFPNGGHFTFEHGIMFNLNEQYALGAANYGVFDERYSDFRGGFKVRLRRWLDHGLSANLSTGLIIWGDSYGERLPELAGDVGLSYKDWIAFYVGLDYSRLMESDALNGANWHTGLKFGSYPGGVLTGAAAVLGVIAGIAYSIAG
jgi:hypothetical protein